MMDDPIVEEVHRIREEMLARYGGDLHALITDMQKRTEEAARSGREVSTPQARPFEPQSGPSQKKR